MIRFTRKRSNQRKITSKHRSYRLQSPVNHEFEANGEKNLVYRWNCDKKQRPSSGRNEKWEVATLLWAKCLIARRTCVYSMFSILSSQNFRKRVYCLIPWDSGCWRKFSNGKEASHGSFLACVTWKLHGGSSTSYIRGWLDSTGWVLGGQQAVVSSPR